VNQEDGHVDAVKKELEQMQCYALSVMSPKLLRIEKSQGSAKLYVSKM